MICNIGFKELNGDRFPTISECKKKLPKKTKENVINYLNKAEHIAECPAILRDVFTEKRLRKPLSILSDGMYTWRSDTSYYVEKYDFYPGDEFVAHIFGGK